MPRFIQVFEDAAGDSVKAHFNAGSEADGIAIANAAAGKSKAKWASLMMETPIAVNSGTYTNYRASGTPASGATVRKQAKCVYLVHGPQDKLTVTIPGVKTTYVSIASKTSGIDPASGVGNLYDEEGQATTAFKAARYSYVPRKGR